MVTFCERPPAVDVRLVGLGESRLGSSLREERAGKGSPA